MTETIDAVDIAIVGAGPVGLTLALALAGGPFSVLLIDSRRRGAWASDPRALALSYGTRQLLENLGAWNVNAGTPIETIHVSQRSGFGRTLIDAADYDIPALGYVLRYRDLAASLDARIEAGAGFSTPGFRAYLGNLGLRRATLTRAASAGAFPVR